MCIQIQCINILLKFVSCLDSEAKTDVLLFFCRLEKLNEVFNKKQKALLSSAVSGYDGVVALLVKNSTLISKRNELNRTLNHSGVKYINMFQATHFTALDIFLFAFSRNCFKKKSM